VLMTSVNCDVLSVRTCKIKLVLLLYLHPFNGLFQDNPCWVSRHQKGKPFWILMKQEVMGWHQLDHICKSFALRSAPDRQPCQHLTTQFLQAWCSFCPTDSVKALKA